MRATLTAFDVMAGLSLSDPTSAQGTATPSVSPKPLPAPVGHRQPRQSDVVTSGTATNPSPPAPQTPPPDPSDPDERLNRILNSICRGC
jgi:hypothetical protein